MSLRLHPNLFQVSTQPIQVLLFGRKSIRNCKHVLLTWNILSCHHLMYVLHWCYLNSLVMPPWYILISTRKERHVLSLWVVDGIIQPLVVWSYGVDSYVVVPPCIHWGGKIDAKYGVDTVLLLITNNNLLWAKLI